MTTTISIGHATIAYGARFHLVTGIAAVSLLVLLVAVAIYRLGHANAAPIRARRAAAPTQGRKALSQHDAVEKIREGERFVLNLPGGRHVTIPRPENFAYYGGLAVLAAVGIINWPLAVIIGLGHALSRHSKRDSSKDRAAEIDELRTEIRRLAEMLPRNGEGDQESEALRHDLDPQRPAGVAV